VTKIGLLQLQLFQQLQHFKHFTAAIAAPVFLSPPPPRCKNQSRLRGFIQLAKGFILWQIRRKTQLCHC